MTAPSWSVTYQSSRHILNLPKLTLVYHVDLGFPLTSWNFLNAFLFITFLICLIVTSISIVVPTIWCQNEVTLTFSVTKLMFFVIGVRLASGSLGCLVSWRGLLQRPKTIFGLREQKWRTDWLLREGTCNRSKRHYYLYLKLKKNTFALEKPRSSRPGQLLAKWS